VAGRSPALFVRAVLAGGEAVLKRKSVFERGEL
jgi:hypothetical protein